MKLKNLFVLATFTLSVTALVISSCNNENEPLPSPPEEITDPNEPYKEGDEIIFLCDFQDMDEVTSLVTPYKLDGLTPSSDMQEVGFSIDKSWLFKLRDSYTSKNYFAGSTSKFSPAGQANAWLVTIPITIPAEGERYVLSWKSESLSLDKRDGLKVFISTKGGNPESDFPTTPEWEIEEETAGNSEVIDGEWAEHEISLEKYAGKDIRIAFVNQSNDKYVLCIDDICVKKKMGFELLSTVDKQTTEDAITIKGLLTAKTEEITEYTVHYVTADSIVHTEHYRNLSIQPGESHTFEFKDKMAIGTKGEYVSYKIWASVKDMDKIGLADSIAAFTFMPQHKIVLEEGTGTWCGWCPLGILSIENLQNLYPDNMIAIAVHNDDAMTVAEYDKGLRFATFPNGIINRKYQCQPMDDSGNNYSFEGKTTFLNMFQQAIQETPFIEPRILQAQITDNIIKVKSEVKFALNPRSNHYRVIYVITENDVETKATQHNYLSPYNLPIFGEFGKGGKFGTSVIKGYKFQEVARGIYPSFNGADGMLPANINSSQTYPLEYEIALSDATINNMEKLDVTIMITDENSGEILNADQIKVTR